MKPRDHPPGTTGPIVEEPIIIDTSMKGPEEAGTNARSPSQNYENVEEA